MNIIYFTIQMIFISYYFITLYKAKISDKPKDYKYGYVIILSFMIPMGMLWMHSMEITGNQTYDGSLDPVTIGSEESNYKVTVYPYIKYDFLSLKKIKVTEEQIGGKIFVYKYIPTDIKIYSSYNNWYYKKDLIEKEYDCDKFNLSFKKCVDFVKNNNLNL